MKDQLTIIIDVHEDGSAWASITGSDHVGQPTIGKERRRHASDEALLKAIAAAIHNARNAREMS
jgi:hypothetical protein